MNLAMYMKTQNKKKKKRLAELAGTSYIWLGSLGNGHGTLGIKLAIKLEAASRLLSSGNNDHMTVNELLDIDKKVLHFIVENNTRKQA